MPDDPLHRTEFDGYVRRHETDQTAHARMRHDMRSEVMADLLRIDNRLTRLEFWQQRMIGGLGFGALVLGSGIITAVIEFSRR